MTFQLYAMGSSPSKPTESAQSDSCRSFSEKSSHTSHALSQSLADLRISQPLSADGALTLGHVDNWEDVVAQSPKLQLSRTILNHTNIRETLVSRKAAIADAHVFNNEVDFKTNPITNQKSSGRCWLFATTNVLRYTIMKKLNLGDFQLSQVRPEACVHLHRLIHTSCRHTSSSGIS